MSGIIEWIKANWGSIVSAVCGVILVSSIVVGLTPSTKDDGVVRKIINFLDNFSLVKTADDKELIRQAESKLKDEEKKG